jgi:hypothetical protein
MMLEHRVRRLEKMAKQSDAPEKPLPRRLQTAQDVIDLLQEQVETLLAERWVGAVQKARAIGYLAGLALNQAKPPGLGGRNS